MGEDGRTGGRRGNTEEDEKREKRVLLERKQLRGHERITLWEDIFFKLISVTAEHQPFRGIQVCVCVCVCVCVIPASEGSSG